MVRMESCPAREFFTKPRGILCIALAIYLLWVIATYLLEGRVLTLLRPDAMLDRVVYTIIANILIGSLLAIVVIRYAITHDLVTARNEGFQPLKRTLIAVVLAIAAGIVMLLVLVRPAPDPVVLINIYAQVFPVTVAEIAVCWAMTGAFTEGAFFSRGRIIAMVCGVVVASVLFGVYHFAHSPPFNLPGTVLFLTLVGVATSLVYFLGRDIYATMAFHNCFGCVGVMQSLAASGLVGVYARPMAPVMAMAVISLVIFVFAEIQYVRK